MGIGQSIVTTSKYDDMPPEMIKQIKSQWEVNRKNMVKIGRYFYTNNDFINLMKVCKKYHDIVEEYEFNPVSDPSLFINMERQHFYNKTDVSFKKSKMRQYLYWYNDYTIKKFKEGDVYKSGVLKKYILSQQCLLEQWSRKKFDKVLYDSQTHGKKGKDFRERIIGHSNLFFFVADDNDNVFGHYHPGVVDKVAQRLTPKGMFMFCIYTNGRCDPTRFDVIKGQQSYTYIWNDDNYYDCAGYKACKIDTNNSSIQHKIDETYINISDRLLIGSIGNYMMRRLVVVEMK